MIHNNPTSFTIFCVICYNNMFLKSNIDLNNSSPNYFERLYYNLCFLFVIIILPLLNVLSFPIAIADIGEHG
jgi:hypothetical protein